MKTKDLVFMALLMGMGFVLHSIIPSYFFMKPDMLVLMMFVGILLFPHVKHVTVLSILAGIITAMTTGFPGGQLPNLIEKPITAFVVFALFLILKKKDSIVSVGLLMAVGTIVSGSVFLFLALMIADLPASFFALFLTIVLPATVVNTFVGCMVYPIVKKIKKR